MNPSTSESSTLQLENGQQKPCDGYKAHHIKCDKNVNGCKNCSKRGIPCTYLIERKRRGPKTKVDHFMRYYESLYNNNLNQASNILVTKDKKSSSVENETYCNSQYTLDLNFNTHRSSNLNSSFVLNENVPHQTSSNMLSIYQNTHNPMLDANYYSLPLPHDFASAVSADSLSTSTITTIATTAMDYELNPIYSPLTQPSFENCTILDQNGCTIYFN
ncbi:hypothetical protein CONCODRAFT_3766 [Conidiobolus coronatus NRRL 28638]|uniref:Zn(2)-C6 fungal-type domain-containing protein n=1 Tax=Conidiobolus coronatus (strain ATCC 28846 / CBS 209.66 / NRRL 28638) TaxID=796925 RepID=A0A137PE59_CONC2|nr:hypothetical protein CONCODRAFT_3766 [Conidiobolus coronatus NRRL 28638]|eukprot:KXN73288.1 hypothetical protein CONCODRAFT_3766 [Conidiobolus coronatus NRRL 28638]